MIAQRDQKANRHEPRRLGAGSRLRQIRLSKPDDALEGASPGARLHDVGKWPDAPTPVRPLGDRPCAPFGDTAIGR
jgi:hypothetical protein